MVSGIIADGVPITCHKFYRLSRTLSTDEFRPKFREADLAVATSPPVELARNPTPEINRQANDGFNRVI
jgi:hypothetical protein